MSKSIYDEALKESKDFGAFVGLRLDRVNNALEQAKKQEELLNKIKEIIDRQDDSYISSMLEESQRYYEIKELMIKEEKNEKTIEEVRDWLIGVGDLKPYKTPHERLLKLGWKMWDTDGTYKTYDKFDDKYSRRTMSIKINKDKDGWYFTTHMVFMDKELTTILLEYLEEVEKEK